MLDTTNFIVRISGKKNGCFYIDYVGLYKIADISKTAKVGERKLEQIYRFNGGVLDEENGVYYFPDEISAKKTISDIFAVMKPVEKGRSIRFTEAEIEYIRKSLINDGSGFAGIDSRIQAEIFKKLNG